MEFLSQTCAGKTHEKKVADREAIAYPPNTVLYQDTGFQGYEPLVKKTCQPKKRPDRKPARIRIQVEHGLAGVKRARTVKDTLRNTKEGDADAVMEAACGLHNLRVRNRRRR